MAQQTMAVAKMELQTSKLLEKIRNAWTPHEFIFACGGGIPITVLEATASQPSLSSSSTSGLLGKRPAEFGGDDNGIDRDGAKRLKDHQSRPLKNVQLQARPLKEEATGQSLQSTAVELPSGLKEPSQNSHTSPDLGLDLDLKPDPELNLNSISGPQHVQAFPSSPITLRWDPKDPSTPASQCRLTFPLGDGQQ
ncbi:hypothetical protein GGR51DRAFT_19059 [Nemania sp. FL0031]|nr:hypothetical protein GGR51DRAFT_19059 [Nemania sp. FL0031]